MHPPIPGVCRIITYDGKGNAAKNIVSVVDVPYEFHEPEGGMQAAIRRSYGRFGNVDKFPFHIAKTDQQVEDH